MIETDDPEEAFRRLLGAGDVPPDEDNEPVVDDPGS